MKNCNICSFAEGTIYSFSDKNTFCNYCGVDEKNVISFENVFNYLIKVYICKFLDKITNNSLEEDLFDSFSSWRIFKSDTFKSEGESLKFNLDLVNKLFKQNITQFKLQNHYSSPEPLFKIFRSHINDSLRSIISRNFCEKCNKSLREINNEFLLDTGCPIHKICFFCIFEKNEEEIEITKFFCCSNSESGNSLKLIKKTVEKKIDLMLKLK